MNPAAVCTGEWVTYIFDMSVCGNGSYKPNENGIYTKLGHILMAPWAAGFGENYKNHYVDIAYAAVVKDLGGVVALLDQDNVILGTASAVSSQKTKTELCAMDGNHGYTDITDKTHTTPSCDKCGLVGGIIENHNYVKNADGVYACDCGAVLEDVTYYVGANGLIAYGNRANDLGVQTEDGVTYHSFGPNPNKNSTTDLCITASVNAVDNNGKYLVIKMRTNTTSVGWEAWFNMYVNGGQATNRCKPQTSAIEGDEWTTIVIDLEKAGRTAVFTPDGEEYPDVQVVFTPYCASAFLDESSTVDVAYIAFCSSIDGIINVVDQDSVVYQEVTDGNGNCRTLTLEQLAALDQAAQ
jgi:hypothetical protein